MRAMASRTLQLFQRDERGAIIIVFAFALILLLGIIGGAVDYGKWLKAKNATQAAMDAAVLAAGRVLQLPGATESEALVAAQKYYDENKPGLLNPDNVTFQTALQGTEIIATSAASGVATPFLGVMGISSLPVNTTSKARLAASKNNGTDVEISMMLDTTGSMSGQKMADLKQAAKDLIDIVVWPDQSSYTSKVALAPFSQYVNVGTANFTAITGQTAGGGTDERTCVKERSDRYTDESPTVGGFFDRYTGTSTCKPTATIMPLSNDKVALKAHVDAFPATGTTAGHLDRLGVVSVVTELEQRLARRECAETLFTAVADERFGPAEASQDCDPDDGRRVQQVVLRGRLDNSGAYVMHQHQGRGDRGLYGRVRHLRQQYARCHHAAVRDIVLALLQRIRWGGFEGCVPGYRSEDLDLAVV